MRMDPQHPRWEEFLGRLQGPEGCNFRIVQGANKQRLTWDCSHFTDYPLCARILANMGLSASEVLESFVFFHSWGAYCDCKVPWRVRKNAEA